MARYVTTVVSARPADEVFDQLAAFDHVADWDPGVVACPLLCLAFRRIGDRAAAGLRRALADTRPPVGPSAQ